MPLQSLSLDMRRRVMKPGSHRALRPMNIWIIRLKRITAVIAVSPGIALAGEAQTKAKISISDAKDV
jgi:hypothetical protein